MDFILAVLMLVVIILFGIFWKELVNWLFHKK